MCEAKASGKNKEGKGGCCVAEDDVEETWNGEALRTLDEGDRLLPAIRSRTAQVSGDDVAARGFIYGGHDSSFVEDVPEELLCNICTKVLKSPCLTECCGQNFCKSCLEHWSTYNKQITLAQGSDQDPTSCPHCRTKDFNHIIDKKTERIVKELTVFCTYRKDGCDWRGELGDVDAHNRKCKFAFVECSKGCGMQVPRKKVQEHLSLECPMREHKCQFCGEEGTYQHMTQKHQLSCTEFVLTCPNSGCGQEMTRKELSGHLQLSCSMQELPCPFKGAGCGAMVPRCDLQSHVEKCQGNHLPEALLLLQSEVRSIRREMEGLREENARLKNELAFDKESKESFTLRLSELEQSFNSFRHILCQELSFLHVSQEPSQQLALECLTSQLQSIPPKLEIDGRHLTFRLNGYSELKHSEQVWYSPSFLIGDGYCVCMAVHVLGLDIARQTHIAVGFHLQPGQHDDNLSWPVTFHNEFKVMLMKQAVEATSGKSSTLPKIFSYHHPDSPVTAKKKSTTMASSSNPELLPAESQYLCCFSTAMYRTAEVVGPLIAKLDMFCLKKKVEELLYQNTLLFRCSLHSSNLTSSLNNSGGFDRKVSGGGFGRILK